MGSLPNLHELSKDKLESPAYRPAPIGGLGPIRLPAQPPPLAHTHRRARSSGHHHTLWDNDAMLEVWYLFVICLNSKSPLFIIYFHFHSLLDSMVIILNI